MFGCIDFSMISTNMISGLEEKEIAEICGVQAMLRNDPHLVLEDFNDIPAEIEESLDKLEMEAIPTSTANQEKKWLKEFVNFLQNKELSSSFDVMTKGELADRLRYFYAELKTKKGEYYSKSSLSCIRAGLYRYFKRNFLFDIINDVTFIHANNVLKAMAKKWIENGGNVKSFDAIEEEDMVRLRSYFKRDTPENLQEEFYFVLVYYLGLRGREWIRRLRKGDVKFLTDANGRDYVEVKGIDSIQKNQQPSLDKSKISIKNPRIYKTNEENKDTCPYTAVQLFIEKLPTECEFLFYKKNNRWKPESTMSWFNEKQPMGVNSIGSLMKKISKDANLSKPYTGHCIRPTVVTNLFNEGVPMDEISCVTGHKNTKSVINYLRNVNDEKKMHYSTVLEKSFHKNCSKRTLIRKEDHETEAGEACEY